MNTPRRQAAVAAVGFVLITISGMLTIVYLNAPGANGLPRSPRVHRLMERWVETIEHDHPKNSPLRAD